ncbi:MAG TPA: glycosyltransferase [Armatimonadota bacterium]|nr:glycosyltransferase [Armatimonadota bacterium]
MLYITPYVPSRIRVRPYNLIKKLARHHEVVLVPLVQTDHDRQALGEMCKVCCSVKPIRMSKTQSVASCGKKLFTRMPLQAAYTYQPMLTRTVDELIARQSFNIVHVEHIRGAHFAAHVGSLPKVYDSVDCITLLLRQFLKTKKNPVSWFLALEEWAKMRVYEAMISERFDKIVITSAHDQKALDGLLWDRIRKRVKLKEMPARPPETPEELEEWRVTRQLAELSQDSRLAALMPQGGRVSVVPNGVDHEYFSPMDIPEEPDSIVFSGKMSYYANEAAVLHFYENIFPIVKAHRPKVRFNIVGADPPPAIRKLADDPSVTVTGYVDDIRPYIAKAAVAVSPITVGVGIQNKVLEAMSMGKSVVASARACSAIAVENGRDVLVADEPVEFADHVIKLLDSPGKRYEIGRNAANYVRRNHDWGEIAEKLASIYQEAAEVFGAKKGRSSL